MLIVVAINHCNMHGLFARAIPVFFLLFIYSVVLLKPEKFMNNSRFRSFANIVKGKNPEPKMKEEKKKRKLKQQKKTMQNKCIAT